MTGDLGFKLDSQEIEAIMMSTMEDTHMLLPGMESSETSLNSFQPDTEAKAITYRPPHLDRTPDLQPIIKNEYDFDVIIPPDSSNCWVFKDQRLYIKIKTPITVNVSYFPTNHNERMFLRAMMIFSSPQEMHLPVHRCAHHCIPNVSEEQGMNIMKSVHQSCQYNGHKDGTTFGDRLSVVIPIDYRIDENGKVTETFVYEFGCQNSCSTGINRKATSIVFTLEDMHCQLLGKRAIQVKVCSCPKRDSERDSASVKRKGDANNAFPRGKKPKLPNPIMETVVKSEPEEPQSPNSANEMSSQGNGIMELKLQVPTDLAAHTLRIVHDAIAGKMASDRTVNDDVYKKLLKDYRKKMQEFFNH